VAAEPHLLGLAEIAKRLGVSKPTAFRYRKRPDFPEPVHQFAIGPLWDAAAVDAWAREHLPLPRGRPTKLR
jgi:predicted DNA-binding transcriptional regulator AlpA